MSGARQFTEHIGGHPARFDLHIDDNHQALWIIQYCGRATQASYETFTDRFRGERWLTWARQHPRP